MKTLDDLLNIKKSNLNYSDRMKFARRELDSAISYSKRTNENFSNEQYIFVKEDTYSKKPILRVDFGSVYANKLENISLIVDVEVTKQSFKLVNLSLYSTTYHSQTLLYKGDVSDVIKYNKDALINNDLLHYLDSAEINLFDRNLIEHFSESLIQLYLEMKKYPKITLLMLIESISNDFVFINDDTIKLNGFPVLYLKLVDNLVYVHDDMDVGDIHYLVKFSNFNNDYIPKFFKEFKKFIYDKELIDKIINLNSYGESISRFDTIENVIKYCKIENDMLYIKYRRGITITLNNDVITLSIVYKNIEYKDTLVVSESLDQDLDLLRNKLNLYHKLN